MDSIRKHVLPLCGLQLWHHVHKRRRDYELSRNPRLKVTWEVMETKRILSSYPEDEACSSFLSSYDERLQDDPAEAIRSAHALLKSLGKKSDCDSLPRRSFFFPLLLNAYVNALTHESEDAALPFCQSLLAFLTELLSQVTTRRYLLVFVKDRAVVAHSRSHPRLAPLVERLEEVMGVDVDEWSGGVLTEEESAERYYKKMLVLQNVIFKWV